MAPHPQHPPPSAPAQGDLDTSNYPPPPPTYNVRSPNAHSAAPPRMNAGSNLHPPYSVTAGRNNDEAASQRRQVQNQDVMWTPFQGQNLSVSVTQPRRFEQDSAPTGLYTTRQGDAANTAMWQDAQREALSATYAQALRREPTSWLLSTDPEPADAGQAHPGSDSAHGFGLIWNFPETPSSQERAGSGFYPHASTGPAFQYPPFPPWPPYEVSPDPTFVGDAIPSQDPP